MAELKLKEGAPEECQGHEQWPFCRQTIFWVFAAVLPLFLPVARTTQDATKMSGKGVQNIRGGSTFKISPMLFPKKYNTKASRKQTANCDVTRIPSRAFVPQPAEIRLPLLRANSCTANVTCFKGEGSRFAWGSPIEDFEEATEKHYCIGMHLLHGIHFLTHENMLRKGKDNLWENSLNLHLFYNTLQRWNCGSRGNRFHYSMAAQCLSEKVLKKTQNDLLLWGIVTM